MKKLNTPPMSWQNSRANDRAKNSSDDFLAYGLFLRRGRGEPNDYSNIPPMPIYKQ